MKGSGSSLARAQSGIPTGTTNNTTGAFPGVGAGPSATPFSFTFPGAQSPSGGAAGTASTWPSSFSSPQTAPQPTFTASPSAAPTSAASPATSSHASHPNQSWEPTFKRDAKPDDPFSALLRSLTSILNKIGPRNLESLVRELVDHLQGQCVHDGKRGVCGEGLKDPRHLFLFTHTIYEKALEDPAFSDIYALVCRVIDPFCPKLEKASLQEFLVSLCENELDDYFEQEDEKEHQESEEDDTDDDEEEGQTEGSARQQQRNERKRRLRNSLKFAAELYNSGLMSTLEILQTADYLSEQADSIEFCCHLLRYAGPTMDLKTELAIKHNKVEPPYYHSVEEAVQYQKFIDRIYENLSGALAQHELSNRVSFMVQDLLEERDNNWQKPAPQPAPVGPPRKPPITVRRSNKQSTAGAAPQPAIANPTPTLPSSAPSSVSHSSASPATSSNVPPWSFPATSSSLSSTSTGPSPPAGDAVTTNPSAQPTNPPSATDPAAVAAAAAKRERLRSIANAIVKPLKDTIQWADEMERRMDAQNLRTQGRVEEVNRAFLTRLKEILDRLHKQLGDVPFLLGLMNSFNAYIRDSIKLASDPATADRAPFDPRNIQRLKVVMLERISKVEQTFGSNTAPAAKVQPSTPPRTEPSSVDRQPSPSLSTLPAINLGIGSKLHETSTAHPTLSRVPLSSNSADTLEEVPSGWIDPDLHKLTRGKPLTAVISGWEEELAAYTTNLNRNAQLVATMDKVSRSVDLSLSEMTKTITQVAIAQTEVDKGLDVIHKHQQELDDKLTELEQRAYALLPSENADLQREQSHTTANQLRCGFKEVEHDLRQMVENFNASLTRQHSAQEQQVRELEEVLNNSLHALQWMESTSGLLERKLRRLRLMQPPETS